MMKLITFLLGIFVTIAAAVIADMKMSESHHELTVNQQQILHNQQQILQKIPNSQHEHKTQLEVKQNIRYTWNESQNILKSSENSRITGIAYQNKNKKACRLRELRNWSENWNNNRHKG